MREDGVGGNLTGQASQTIISKASNDGNNSDRRTHTHTHTQGAGSQAQAHTRPLLDEAA